MSLTNEDRAYILEEHLRTVYGISDKEYQRRVWIRAEGHEVDDYDETTEHFLDSSEWILKNPKAYGLTEAQFTLLDGFRDAFEAFDDGPHSYHPRDFIDTPEWDRIVKMAGEVLKAFNYQKPSPPEV